MAYDLIIKNGKVIDGSGLPGFHGDVAVSGGKIVEIGRVSGERGGSSMRMGWWSLRASSTTTRITMPR